MPLKEVRYISGYKLELIFENGRTKFMISKSFYLILIIL